MKSTNVISCIFALALTVFEILTFEIFDLEKVGQGHRVQHWHCRRQIANVKIYKRNFLHFWFSPRFDPCERLSQTDRQTDTQSYMTWPWLIGKSTDSTDTNLEKHLHAVSEPLCEEVSPSERPTAGTIRGRLSANSAQPGRRLPHRCISSPTTARLQVCRYLRVHDRWNEDSLLHVRCPSKI